LKYIKTLTAAILAALLFILPFSSFAEENDGTEDIPLEKATAYYIGTADGAKALKSSDLSARFNPASTVKIMSGLLMCEFYADRLDERINVTDDMVEGVTGRYVGMKKGSKPTVRDLLYLGFCGGFNDAVMILGYNAYGSELDFVTAMNRKAAELGMKDTFYSNSTGVHNANNTTTLKDLKTLAVAAYQCKLYMTVTSAVSYSTEGLGTPFSFTNTNSLLTSGTYTNNLCRGMNAGNTPESGYGVVTVAEKNGVPYVCIVMGAQSDTKTTYSFAIANKLIAWAFNRYGTKTLIDTTLVVCEIPVSMSVKTKSVVVVPDDSVSAFIPLSYTLGNEITYEYELFDETLDAPVEAGQKVGRITVYCEGSAIATVGLITKNAADKSDILEGMQKIKDFTSGDFFIGTCITAAVLTFLYLTALAFIRGSKKKKKSLK